MKLTPRFSHGSPGQVCRLKKSLYGLKQAPCYWFAKLSEALQKSSFRQSRSNYCLFIHQALSIFLCVLVYVDDFIITGTDPTAIHNFKRHLSSYFHIKDLGSLNYFLGIEVARNSTCIHLCQRKYALDILTDAGLLGAKLVDLTMEQCHTLGKAKGPFLSSPDSYRRLIEYLIEYLIYLTITHSTWPNQSTFWHSSCTSLARTTNATMCVLRSRKGSPGQGLFLSVNTDLELSAYCDSNWASCPSLVDL